LKSNFEGFIYDCIEYYILLKKSMKIVDSYKINDARVSFMTERDLLFSLDIGTRTVVGIVGFHDGHKFIVQAFDVEEHKERAMYDGQVHDIELVAKAVLKVKNRLEKRIGLKLEDWEYDLIIHYFFKIGLEFGYIQEHSSAAVNYVPAFNLSGV